MLLERSFLVLLMDRLRSSHLHLQIVLLQIWLMIGLLHELVRASLYTLTIAGFWVLISHVAIDGLLIVFGYRTTNTANAILTYKQTEVRGTVICTHYWSIEISHWSRGASE